MHKRNIALTAGMLTGGVTGLFLIFPELPRSELLATLYFPAILLSVVFSGGSHSPSELAIWTSFLLYTLAFSSIGVLAYVFVHEFLILRKASQDLREARERLLEETPNFRACLDKFGNAVRNVEKRHRASHLFQSIETIDLSKPNDLIAAQVLTEVPQQRWIDRLKLQLGTNVERDRAQMLMKSLSEEAIRLNTESKIQTLLKILIPILIRPFQHEGDPLIKLQNAMLDLIQKLIQQQDAGREGQDPSSTPLYERGQSS